MIRSVNLNLEELKTEQRKNKATVAAKKLLEIFQSNQFKLMILQMPDEYRIGDTSSKELKEMSNRQIYNLIMSGKEEWNKEVDYQLDLEIRSYYSIKNVVGYMIPYKPTIHVNTKFFDSNSIMRVCSNFAHEYMHTLGFRHGGKNFRKSIPYYINYVIESLYHVNNNQIYTEYTVCRRVWWKLWLGKSCKTHWRVND